MRGDGDGWFRGLDGVRRWGRYGAAGLLIRAPIEESCTAAVLLQCRRRGSAATRGTWTIPGGARDSHETAVEAALREAWEESGIRAADVSVRGERTTSTALGGWTFTTVVADADTRVRATAADGESSDVRWVPEAEVALLPLHPDFRLGWSRLRADPVSLMEPPGAGRVAGALPRTVDLAQGFVWIHRHSRCVLGCREARLTDGPIPFYQHPTQTLLLRPGQLR